MKEVNTFPPGTIIRKIASSRGSNGHSLCITTEGKVYSWGDGEEGCGCERVMGACGCERVMGVGVRG